ncbi:MAG: rhamnulokinase [Planctomycetia bacterium]|nr:rhamnulokinase [Planctomycetia bacterium]
MAAAKVFLALDLGASNGRVVAGVFDGAKLRLEDVCRFDNGPVSLPHGMHWDLLALWKHVQQGLRAARDRFKSQVASVGVDTWGVDFGLLGRGDVLLANPHHYRDHRTDGLMERAFAVVSRSEIFAQTGLQFMQFNTLYQFWALRLANSPLLDVAERLLMIPDLFHWMLTGCKTNEFTNATTTQFYNPHTKDWARDLLRKFDLPDRILGEITPPGTDLGKMLPQVAAETGLAGVRVIVPGTHDTASAVMSVPAASRPGELPDWCYISSGTWSLMGVETPRPVTTDLCLKLNFTNEGGVGGTIRLLKNITGLWLLQECRRVWNQTGKNYSWEDLNRASDAAPRLRSLVDPDLPGFMAPPDMPAAIRQACRQSGEPEPADEGGVIRCALESMAMKYRMVLSWLEQLIGRRMETIHVVGGGTQNRRLCQAAADATGRRVVAGPVEATAIGNLMMQAVAAGDVGSIAEAREVIGRSFSVEEYSPRETAAWDEAYVRFERIVAG